MGEFIDDERVDLVRRVFRDAFNVDHATGRVTFHDPADGDFKPDERRTIQAVPLAYRENPDASERVNGFAEEWLEHENGRVKSYLPAARPGGRSSQCLVDCFLERISDQQKLIPTRRPFSSYRIGPIPPKCESGCSTFFRFTVELRDDVYDRLVGPTESSPFEMTSSKRVVEVLSRYFERRRPTQDDDQIHHECKQFFAEDIMNRELSHNSYQIIIGQPQWETEQQREEGKRNLLVQVRPTSSNVTERYIRSTEVRKYAQWFHSWGPDFSLVLRYGDVPSSADVEGSFRRPASSMLCPADPIYSVELSY